MSRLLVNIDDVDYLDRGIRFYTGALGHRGGRRFSADAVELLGAEVPIYLLVKRAGTTPFAGGSTWSPRTENVPSRLVRARRGGGRLYVVGAGVDPVATEQHEVGLLGGDASVDVAGLGHCRCGRPAGYRRGTRSAAAACEPGVPILESSSPIIGAAVRADGTIFVMREDFTLGIAHPMVSTCLSTYQRACRTSGDVWLAGSWSAG
jgi:hypothetical protein